jgi:cytochrome d ubiquinol oxidase subunit II
MPNGAVAILVLSLVLYAVLGGADFGGGILDLCVRGPLAVRARAAVARVIGPVWEANHVWLIFAITIAFTVYPLAFAAACERLYVPLNVALVGIVLRGAAFAFRSYAHDAAWFRRAPGHVFGAASLLAPIGLGFAAGALAEGRTYPGATWHAFVGPLATAAAAMAVCACAYLAATYMAFESRAAHDDELEALFRRYALRAGTVLSALALVGLGVAARVAPLVWRGLVSRGAPYVAASAVAGACSLAALAGRRYGAARALAAGAIGCIIVGWIVAQWPLLVVPDVTAALASAPR